jgi:hypothetical protein
MAGKHRSNKRTVLADHHRRGKKFVPPLVHMLPAGLREISWLRTMLPEVVWIALLHRTHGDHRAVELITALGRAARKHSPNASSKIFGTTTAYEQLSEDQQAQVRSSLALSGDLLLIQDGIRPLVALYPQCPLRFLFVQAPAVEEPAHLRTMIAIVEQLHDRMNRETVMVQASLTWLGFDSGMLKVSEGLALAEFPKVQDYPANELSRKIASSIRAGLFMFFEPPHYPGSASWARHFWNRGLEISRCQFAEGNHDGAD